MLSQYGTEQVGISVEVALADLHAVQVEPAYRARARKELIEHILPALIPLTNEFPVPTKHIAEDQNPVDFLLLGDQTLSVKSNMRDPGKVAPQNIGQPTSNTFWARLPGFIPAGVDVTILSYSESSLLFKEVAQTKIVELLGEYWKNLFDCDFMIYVYDVVDRNDNLSFKPQARVLRKIKCPIWQKERITFSKPVAQWNESCTVKYDNVSIGEFQIHANRNCFKFRYNFKGLIQSGLI